MTKLSPRRQLPYMQARTNPVTPTQMEEFKAALMGVFDDSRTTQVAAEPVKPILQCSREIKDPTHVSVVEVPCSVRSDIDAMALEPPISTGEFADHHLDEYRNFSFTLMQFSTSPDAKLKKSSFKSDSQKACHLKAAGDRSVRRSTTEREIHQPQCNYVLCHIGRHYVCTKKISPTQKFVKMVTWELSLTEKNREDYLKALEEFLDRSTTTRHAFHSGLDWYRSTRAINNPNRAWDVNDARRPEEQQSQIDAEIPRRLAIACCVQAKIRSIPDEGTIYLEELPGWTEDELRNFSLNMMQFALFFCVSFSQLEQRLDDYEVTWWCQQMKAVEPALCHFELHWMPRRMVEELAKHTTDSSEGLCYNKMKLDSEEEKELVTATLSDIFTNKDLTGHEPTGKDSPGTDDTSPKETKPIMWDSSGRPVESGHVFTFRAATADMKKTEAMIRSQWLMIKLAALSAAAESVNILDRRPPFGPISPIWQRNSQGEFTESTTTVETAETQVDKPTSLTKMQILTDEWLEAAQAEKLATLTETEMITSAMPEEAQAEKLAIPTETKNPGPKETRQELSTTVAETETPSHEGPAAPTRTKRAKEHVKTLAHRAMSMVSMRSSAQHEKQPAKTGRRPAGNGGGRTDRVQGQGARASLQSCHWAAPQAKERHRVLWAGCVWHRASCTSLRTEPSLS
ncbi:predicted protein [Verticillium alfalfae VaMs.102]|uniref:Predicted protein n=1 Tax=Verticillium alfalfae (strain VaMs.102 / ATCC MYA-4576 / FGSC 10136) TaxID=526221 RepID=C9SV13_VERA1|nr:predicted protein [Verticillium alfalfae VaMs.102]EEY22628.1 predicted protein [Verticillium alfalfae VaMs.102]